MHHMSFSGVHEAAFEGNRRGHPVLQLVTEHPVFKKAGHDLHEHEYRQHIPNSDVGSQQNNQKDGQMSCKMHFQQGDQQIYEGTWPTTCRMSESSPVCGNMRDLLGDGRGGGGGGREHARGCEEATSWMRGTGEGIMRLHLENDRPVHARCQGPPCISHQKDTLVAAERTSWQNRGNFQSHVAFIFKA